MKQFVLLNAVSIATTLSAQVHIPVVISPDSIRIAYEVHGEGSTALVFVHGWSCDRSYWKDQIEAFSQQFKVVAIDLAGHGESGLGRKDWTIESFGSDVASVVTKLELNHVILIGHSMGGDVIAEAARQLQNRVTGLIMVDVYKKLGPGRAPAEVEAFVSRLRSNFADSTKMLVRSMFVAGSDSVLVDRVAADMSSAPPEVALSALQHAFSYSRQMPYTLEQLKLPVIAINPDNSPTDIESMKRYGVEVMIMQGIGHFLMMEDPERFNGILKTAIEKLMQ